MNRDTAVKALTHMREGRRVVVVAATVTQARQAFTAAAAHAVAGERIRRANGAEQITAAGGPGWVRFLSAGRLRGTTADVVVVVGFLPDLAAVVPVVLASPAGEVVVCVAAG